MSRLLAAMLCSLPAAGVAETAPAPPLLGATTLVNGGIGDQTDPHVSGDWVAYTSAVSGNAEIRFQNLYTRLDAAVPGSDGIDFIADISGYIVVYTHLTSSGKAIFAFDVSRPDPPVELAPAAGSLRERTSVGGGTVAWVDFGLGEGAGLPEIVTYDLATSQAAQLTDDEFFNTNPSVSPDGSMLVYERCASFRGGCDIWQATRISGGWMTQALTTGADEDRSPETNGEVVVYHSVRAGESDIYWQPVGGGEERRLALAGQDRNPAIAGTWIAFEHFRADASTPNFDVYLYNTATNALYPVSNGLADETLTDLSISSNNVVRIVWAAQEGAESNVYAFSFSLPADCGANPQASCRSPAPRPVLVTTPGGQQGLDGNPIGLDSSERILQPQSLDLHVEVTGGCSSTGGELALSGLLSLLGVWLMQSVRVRARIRADRHR
jgi:hypothetical protein